MESGGYQTGFLAVLEAQVRKLLCEGLTTTQIQELSLPDLKPELKCMRELMQPVGTRHNIVSKEDLQFMTPHLVNAYESVRKGQEKDDSLLDPLGNEIKTLIVSTRQTIPGNQDKGTSLLFTEFILNLVQWIETHEAFEQYNEEQAFLEAKQNEDAKMKAANEKYARTKYSNLFQTKFPALAQEANKHRSDTTTWNQVLEEWGPDNAYASDMWTEKNPDTPQNKNKRKNDVV